MSQVVNIDSPRYDQNTYSGRARHFFITTNPLNLLASSAELGKAKDIVENYRRTQLMPPGLTEDRLWRAKHLYDSAYHPDTGEKMFILGRMSAQVPMNMTITGCMLTFYKTTPQVVLWQWLNQSFNAIVNYTNRSGDSAITTSQLGVSYVLATSAATGSALFLNRLVKSASPLVGRYVPFAAVAVANCLNIPFMRSREVTHGITVFTEDGTRVGDSKTAARLAIGQVLVSRIVMAMPSMCVSPIIMNYLEKNDQSFLRRYPKMNAPFQVGIVGVFLLLATPMCCALFPQKSSISVSKLEEDVRQKLEELGKADEKRVYFNKGL